MAIPTKIGHDRRGVPVFKTTAEGEIVLDGNQRPIADDHLPLVTSSFKKWIITKGLI